MWTRDSDNTVHVHVYIYVTGSHQPFSHETWWSEDLSLSSLRLEKAKDCEGLHIAHVGFI